MDFVKFTYKKFTLRFRYKKYFIKSSFGQTFDLKTLNGLHLEF